MKKALLRAGKPLASPKRERLGFGRRLGTFVETSRRAGVRKTQS